MPRPGGGGGGGGDGEGPMGKRNKEPKEDLGYVGSKDPKVAYSAWQKYYFAALGVLLLDLICSVVRSGGSMSRYSYVESGDSGNSISSYACAELGNSPIRQCVHTSTYSAHTFGTAAPHCCSTYHSRCVSPKLPIRTLPDLLYIPPPTNLGHTRSFTGTHSIGTCRHVRRIHHSLS